MDNALNNSIGEARLWATMCKVVFLRMTEKGRGSWLIINYHRFSNYAQCGVKDLEKLHQELEKAMVQSQDTEYIARPDPVKSGDENDTRFMLKVES